MLSPVHSNSASVPEDNASHAQQVQKTGATGSALPQDKVTLSPQAQQASSADDHDGSK